MLVMHVHVLMQYWLCSTGPVFHYLPWGHSMLTFVQHVYHSIHILCMVELSEYNTHLFISQCAIATIGAWKINPDDFNETNEDVNRMEILYLSLLLPLRLCPSVSICLLFFHSPSVCFFIFFPLSQANFLIHCSYNKSTLCHCLDGKSALSGGNLVPFYTSARALIILSIQMWKAPSGSLTL